MAIQAQGGAGGAGTTEAGASGGNANQVGGSASQNQGGAAGTSPGGNGGAAGFSDEANGAGAGGGGGADGVPNEPTGGSGGAGGTSVQSEGLGFGGGGGGGGGAGFSSATNQMLQSAVTGGAGGSGGAGTSFNQEPGGTSYGDGGGGGEGGDGLVLTATGGLTVTIAAGATVTGGNGGAGGLGSNGSAQDEDGFQIGPGPGGDGGAGGAGGDGLFAYDGNTVVNAGTIKGGAGGAGGGGNAGAGPQSGIARGANGAAGAYGAGVVGSNLTLTNTGTIVGGLNETSDIVVGNALTFTSGTNTLTLSSGGTVGTINGNIAVSGSLDIKSGGTPASLGGFALIFGAAATAVTIESGVTLGDTVSGFLAGDTLDLKGLVYSSTLEAAFTDSATGGSLRIVSSAYPTNVVESLTLSGTYTSGVFGLSSDGNGGTTIGFTATPALGMQPNDIATSDIPGSSALVVVDRYNSDYSLYYEDTITKASNGNDTFHFHGGSFFTGKSFAAFDNVTNSSGLLLNQTLYNSAGQATQQTQFNANGSVYLQDNVVYPAAGQVLYQYRSGSFFTGKSFSAFDNLATPGGTLLDQLLYNRDGTHTFTVPGSNLTLTAVKNDTFNVSGSNDTARFNATGFGKDTFSGYKAGDIFSFSTSIFANYAALQQHLSGTSSAVITTSANDTLTLANVAKSSVTSSMFTFS